MPSNHPHDRLTRWVLSRIETARHVLALTLPAGVTRAIDLASLRLESGSFVDEEMRAYRTDLLFRLAWARGGAGLFYLLFEHKSTAERLTAFQVLGYVMRIQRDWCKRHPGAPAPFVLPVVFYHGAAPWNRPVSLAKLIEVPEGSDEHLVRHLPRFEFLLVDLSRHGDEELKSWSARHALEALFLLVLRHGRSPDVGRRLIEWTDVMLRIAATSDGLSALWTLMCYILDVNDQADHGDLVRILAAVPDREVQEMGKTMAERLRDEGRAEGRTEALIEVLEGILRTRFGAVPDEDVQRLRSASCEALRRWLDRALTAETLEDVFSS